MKHKYIPTEIGLTYKHHNKNNIYQSRFDKIFTEVSNHYEKTLYGTVASTIELPTIVRTLQTKSTTRKVLSRYVSPEPPTRKQFKNIYKDNYNIRNKIDEIKFTPNRVKLTLEDYHIKIV
jgi:hypothetical protein